MSVTQHGTAPLPRLLKHLRAHRGTVRAAALCSVLNKIFDLAPPLLIGAAVDIVVRREQSVLGTWGVPSLGAQLWVLAGLTLVIWVLESVFEYAQALLWRNLAQTVQHEMRVDAYEHVQGLDTAWFEDQGTGGLLAVLNDDVNQLERFLDAGANELIQVTTTVLVIGSLFFALAPEVAWMSLLPIPVILWGSVRWQRLLAPRYAAVRNEVSLLSDLLAGNLGGVATIKSFTAEKRELARLTERSEAYREANRQAISLSSAFSPLIRMVIVLGFTAMLVAGGFMALEGQLAVGAYSVLIFLTQRLLWPLTRLGQTFDLYQRAMASTSRILDLLDTPSALADGQKRVQRATLKAELELDQVGFAHAGGGDFALRELTLRFPAGETTAIVGPTGSGKTTLVKLLLRFYDPVSGTVRLDGQDLRELRVRDLRELIGLVSQDVFLFHGSVRENVAFGRPEATEEEIREACRMAEAHEFIEALPRGYDTLVGERGQKLSGGQRQRVSIARAVLKDPPILILDEATSAVDNETEAAIQRSLSRLSEGRTTIVIAHRLSTVRHAHHIHVLQAGRVIESGRHDDLLELGGIYAGLWKVQTGVAEGSLEAG